MTDLRKAAEQAAKELKKLIHWYGIRYSNDRLVPAHNQPPEIKSAMESLDALRQALAESANSTTNLVEPKASSQTEQEPVAKVDYNERGNIAWFFGPQIPDGTLLYSTSLKRQWVGLTASEVHECYDLNPARFASRIEAKLKEKNG